MGGVLLNQDILNNPTLTANENCFPFSQLALHTDLIILSIDFTLKCGEFPDPVISHTKLGIDFCKSDRKAKKQFFTVYRLML